MKISVIMVCMNAAPVIRGALESVRMQEYSDIELVVIDGASNDGTGDIVTEYLEPTDVFVSEKDAGIYNAMNKGLSICSGDVVYFLNSDDRLYDSSVLSQVAGCFSCRDVEIVFGDIEMRPVKRDPYFIRYPDTLGRRFLARRTICHQALFVRKNVFNKVGGFDERFFLVADYLWILRCFFDYEIKFLHADFIVASVDGRGVSYQSSGLEDERRQAMRGYYSWLERKLWREWPVRHARKLNFLRWYAKRLALSVRVANRG